ncbi:MAG: DUF1320 family protein [Bacteroidales bacterium]|nr:DUF1320 family protein [Bacteroidales bacterium]
MFITKEEIKTHLYDYQVDQITDGDDTLITSAIDTAIAEVKAYLANRYDVATIFSQSGPDRSPLIVEHVKVCAVWHLLLLCNVDAIYERYEKAYDRSITFLKQVADGLLSPDLPYLQTSSGQPTGTIQLKSNPKFTHSF